MAFYDAAEESWLVATPPTLYNARQMYRFLMERTHKDFDENQ
jgi:hypothetical protein